MTPQGHLFVVQADLSRIAADAFLIPCDSNVNVSGGWRPFVEPGSEPRPSWDWFRPEGVTLTDGLAFLADPPPKPKEPDGTGTTQRRMPDDVVGLRVLVDTVGVATISAMVDRSIDAVALAADKARRHGGRSLPLRKVRDGIFVPIAPVYVVGDLVDKREFLLALDESVRFLAGEPSPLERRYVERTVKQRLHQAEFRGRVIAAYSTRCAICRLRHGELLDAAHIIADRDDDGLPDVSNGLSLCKIHHAAFDGYLIGISPDFQVRVDRQLLEETDGPMLRYGLQGMHGVRLTLPEQRRDRPDADRLEQRYAEFLRRAS